MSYCVNCGVELDKTCSTCPLCHTPVYNPHQPIDTLSPPPFPMKKGTTEPVERREFTILMSIIFSTIAVVCFILNQLVFVRTHWSVYVIGLCILFWIFLLPMFFPNIIRAWMSLVFNGFSIAAYLAVVSWLHPGNGWYLHIALPITALGTLLILNYYFFSLKRKSSLITRTALFFGSLGILCVSIELLIHLHYQQGLRLSWSGITLICCVSIDIVLIAISFLTGIRAEIRKRMHF